MRASATAVVVTYNSVAQIGPCLAALHEADVAIRVVDNASTDGTVELIRRDFPEVEVLVNTVNVGFSRAVNRGCRGVRDDAILLVNPDCVVPACTTQALLTLLADRPAVGIAGPALVGSDGRLAVSAHPFETLASVVVSRCGGSLLPVGLRRLLGGAERRRTYDAGRDSSGPTTVDWVSGACLAVRTDLLADIGGLDERYFLYYEDEELCLQASVRGSLVVHLPAVRAVHIGGASSALGVTWPHLYRSMLIFFASHRASSYQAVRITILLRALVGMLLGGLRRLAGNRSAAHRTRAWSQVASVALTARRGCSTERRISHPTYEGRAA